MAKPGVMFYFEFRPSLNRLSPEEKGQLLDAMLDYSEFGTEPRLEGVVGVVWDFLKQKVDRDSARYTRSVQQKQYAAHVRKVTALGLPKPDFETWLASQQQDSAQRGTDAHREPDESEAVQPVSDEPQAVQPVSDDCTRLQPVSDDIHTTNSKPQTPNSKPQTSNSKPHTPNTGSVCPAGSCGESESGRSAFIPPGIGEIRRYCAQMRLTLDPDSFFDYYSANGWRIGGNPMRDWQAALRRWDKNGKENTDAEVFPWVIGTHL